VPQDTVFIREIKVGQAGQPSKKFCATATVQVTNARGFVGSGVKVLGHFEGPVSGDASGITESDGRITLFSDRVRIPEGEWRFVVDSLDGNGRVYVPGSNVVNSAIGMFLFDNLPRSVELYDNYPNPFNPATIIDFWLPSPGHVRLDVINMLGQQVEMLLDDDRVAGYHSIIWEASNFSSGIYFYRIESDGTVESRKMVLLK